MPARVKAIGKTSQNTLYQMEDVNCEPWPVFNLDWDPNCEIQQEMKV